VNLLDKEGNVLGCGLTNYSSSELANAKGKKFEKEIIHRDNFVKKE
jgi:glutamate 5-kinase